MADGCNTASGAAACCLREWWNGKILQKPRNPSEAAGRLVLQIPHVNSAGNWATIASLVAWTVRREAAMKNAGVSVSGKPVSSVRLRNKSVDHLTE